MVTGAATNVGETTVAATQASLKNPGRVEGRVPKAAQRPATSSKAASAKAKPKPKASKEGPKGPVPLAGPVGLRIVVNAKAYPEVTGPGGCLALAKACAAVPGVALAPPLAELATLARRRPALGVPLFGQHCDPRVPGAATGWVTAEALQAAGAVGSIVN